MQHALRLYGTLCIRSSIPLTAQLSVSVALAVWHSICGVRFRHSCPDQISKLWSWSKVATLRPPRLYRWLPCSSARPVFLPVFLPSLWWIPQTATSPRRPLAPPTPSPRPSPPPLVSSSSPRLLFASLSYSSTPSLLLLPCWCWCWCWSWY